MKSAARSSLFGEAAAKHHRPALALPGRLVGRDEQRLTCAPLGERLTIAF